MENTDKLICDTYTRPELSELIWNCLREEGPIKKDALENKFAQIQIIPSKSFDSSSSFDYAFEFLIRIKLIKPSSKGFIINPIPLKYKYLLKENSKNIFKLIVLNQLKLLSGKSSKYTNHAHFLITYQTLCELQGQNSQALFSWQNDEALDTIKRGWEALNYSPLKRDGEKIRWNETKFHSWKELATYLGLISQGKRMKDFTLAFDSELCETLMKVFMKDSIEMMESQGFLDLDSFIQYLKDDFLFLNTEVKVVDGVSCNVLNPVIEGLLFNLEFNHVIHLTDKGLDSPRYYVNLLGKTVRTIEKGVGE